MKISGIQSPLLKTGDRISPVLQKCLPVLQEQSILCITSKVVSLEQGRVVRISSSENLKSLIQQESDQVFFEQGNFFLTEKEGILLPNAGIDESNAEEGSVILFPLHAQKYAEELRQKLCSFFGIQKLGILIADSSLVPRRCGISGVCLACAGIKGLSDQRGKKDLFGRELVVSQIAVADNFASIAQNFFGQADERVPFVLFEEVENVVFTDSLQDSSNLCLSEKEDIFPSFGKRD